MMELFKYMTSDFWIFLGCVIIIGIPFKFLYGVMSRGLEHREIMKHGHPNTKQKIDHEIDLEP